MTAEPPERVIRGAGVVGGVAVGPAWRPAVVARSAREAGDPAAEDAALRAALAAAGGQLAALMAAADADGAEILEFQAMLLEDDDLLAPAFASIAQGGAADAAWSGALDAEIAAYSDAGDAVLAARATDLRDLRDRVLACLSGEAAAAAPPPEGAVALAGDLTPSAFLALDWSRLGGAALTGGAAAGHVAILARARGVPLVVGLTAAPQAPDGALVALDADAGALIENPSAETRAALAARTAAGAAERAQDAAAARRPARTAGGAAVRVLVNVDDPALLDALSPQICDGVGLTRTEFLFHGAAAPGEDAQLAVYARILAWAQGRPVTIRTLDAGGDKPIPGVTIDGESNPFLGLRGLRLSLRRPEVFRTQLRALARAAALGPLKIMLPMVTIPQELEQARAHLDAVCAGLAAHGVAHARPALGIMIETPAAALTAADFDADFYSIGSNDLIQYAMAAARDNPAVAHLADPRNPAVLALIGRTVEAGRARGVEVSLCGDMASSPALIGALLDLGLETLSCAPAQVGAVKREIGRVR